MRILKLLYWGFVKNKITQMSSRGLFVLESCWLHIPLYFLHFGSRPFNLLFFQIKVWKSFWKETSWKWNLLCIWLETKLGEQIFLLLKLCVKYTVSPWFTWLFVSIFIKKHMEHLFLGFQEEVWWKPFNSLKFFYQYYTSLYSMYAIDLNKIKKQL